MDSCFVAVKHASAAMKQNPPEARGGSIVLTASGASDSHIVEFRSLQYGEVLIH